MRSGIFNSHIIGFDDDGMPIFDRAEEASFFAQFFANFIGNGVYPNPSNGMQVIENGTMSVKICEGYCFINGYMGISEEEELSLESADNLLSRIDRIVIRLDAIDRSIKPFVKTGTASQNPVAPDVERNSNIYELALADILINKNVSVITQSNITDLRLNSDLCGIVTGVIDQVDTTTLFNQYLTWFNEITTNASQEYQEWFQGFTEPSEEAFRVWFDNIKNILDESTEMHLLNLINEKAPIADLMLKSDKKKIYTITAISANWQGEEAPFSQTIEIEEMLDTDIPNLDVIYSNDLETAISEQAEYAKIDKITSSTGSVTLTCFKEKPEINLNLRVEVIY